jgi:hypothetical protein
MPRRDRYADGSNGFSWCDSVVIDGARAWFDFRRRTWGSMVRYEGEPRSDGMVIATARQLTWAANFVPRQ